jgi:hypothetical protein
MEIMEREDRQRRAPNRCIGNVYFFSQFKGRFLLQFFGMNHFFPGP